MRQRFRVKGRGVVVWGNDGYDDYYVEFDIGDEVEVDGPTVFHNKTSHGFTRILEGTGSAWVSQHAANLERISAGELDGLCPECGRRPGDPGPLGHPRCPTTGLPIIECYGCRRILQRALARLGRVEPDRRPIDRVVHWLHDENEPRTPGQIALAVQLPVSEVLVYLGKLVEAGVVEHEGETYEWFG